MTKYTDIYYKSESSILQCKSFSHFFNKKYWRFEILTFEILMKHLTNNVVSFEQPGPVCYKSALICKSAIKVIGYIMFSHFFKGRQLSGFSIAFPVRIVSIKRCLLLKERSCSQGDLKERICSHGSKFFTLRGDPSIEKGSNYQIAFSESVCIHCKSCQSFNISVIVNVSVFSNVIFR